MILKTTVTSEGPSFLFFCLYVIASSAKTHLETWFSCACASLYLLDSHTICQVTIKEPSWFFRTIMLHLVNTHMAHLIDTWPVCICLYLDIFLWSKYNLLVICSSTTTVKSVSRKAQSGDKMFIKLYALLNRSEQVQEALETWKLRTAQ